MNRGESLKLARRFATDGQPEHRRPAPDRFVRELNAPCGQHLLDHTQAQRESVVQPDRVADDVRRKLVALERNRCLARLQNGDGSFLHGPLYSPTPANNLTVPLLRIQEYA
jgi:hypothetical protein